MHVVLALAAVIARRDLILAAVLALRKLVLGIIGKLTNNVPLLPRLCILFDAAGKLVLGPGSIGARGKLKAVGLYTLNPFDL